jgi:UDP-glucose 4-epimerase
MAHSTTSGVAPTTETIRPQSMPQRTALLTGAAGYIGSHTCVELMAAGWSVVILDNLSNSSAVVIDRIERIAGRRPVFVEGDVRDRDTLRRIFSAHAIDAVVHFAGLKSVGESMAEPLRYYDNNVTGSVVLLESMQLHGVRRIVFSSSATVYGIADEMPLTEESPLAPINAYGRSKRMIEEVIGDVVANGSGWKAMLLRYFNPVGAHPSGSMGEDPAGIPNNLMPYIAQVAVGRHPQLSVYGGDYATPDGTGVRDYIHVMDLASGHVAALNGIDAPQMPPLACINLGTGRGYSVLQVVRAFEEASGRAIAWRIVARRPGDSAQCYAGVMRAHALLGWRAKHDLREMCADAWRWQSANPHGYRGDPS